MSAREFNQSVAQAQRRAEDEPVLVTRHGAPAYVLLSIAEYERLSSAEPGEGAPNAWDLLAPPAGAALDDDGEFDSILTDIRKNTPDRPPFEFG
ncbi:type II toxin-antitoxin system Phd/YefM family antitoxin [Microbacterium sp. Mu-80]|uniref:Antitoxin n=1 Tax=Microbacterium bandirmense TaxID=3122050 RepID=A0ABU8LBJ4_9MICO